MFLKLLYFAFNLFFSHSSSTLEQVSPFKYYTPVYADKYAKIQINCFIIL